MSEEAVFAKKLNHLQQKSLTPGDQLRQLLSDLEDRQATMSDLNSTQALAILRDLDQVYHFFIELQDSKLDLLAEQGRFKAIQARIKRHIKPLLKALGGVEALQTYKPHPAPTEAQWWWHANKIVAQQQKMWQQQLFTITIITIIIFGVVVLAFKTVLAPDPQVIARYELERSTLAAIDVGQYEEALAGIEATLKQQPNDVGFLLMQGILQEALKKPEAAQTFKNAETLINSSFEFYMGRGQLYLRINQPEKAETDLRQALQFDEKSSLAWLLLGQALETQSKKFEATIAYEKAGSFALDKGESEIVVSARMALMRLGTLNIPGSTP